MSAPVMERPARRAGRPEPVAVRPGPDPRIRSKVRVQWLVLAAALVVLAGTLVAWALGNAADRVSVLALARPVKAGETIDADDVSTVQIAIDATVTGLVPPASLDAIVGRVAAVDLGAGALLTIGMWDDATGLAADERSVGAVLSPGRFPSGLGHGSVATALEVRAGVAEQTATTEPGRDAPVSIGVPVRILEVVTDDAGDLVATLAVPAANAESVATWAATGSLALIGVPDGPTTPAGAAEPGAAEPSTAEPGTAVEAGS